MTWPAQTQAATAGLLSGIRILDFSLWLPGPFCTQLFADLGADVIHVEPLEGDPGRAGGWVFEAGHRNKRSVRADLRDECDLQACLSLAANADAVVVGFRPDTTERLGIGYQAIRAVNPAVVYCSISGYGVTGPNRDRPGHDLSFLAQAGALAGMPHWHPGPPRRSPVAVADLSAAFYAAFAMLASLRHRDLTGEPSFLDIGIADAALAVAAPRAGPDFDIDPQSRTGVFVTNEVYEAADGGFVAVSAVESKYWERLRAELVGYEPGLDDERFATEAGRHAHGDELHALLTSVFRRETAEQWEAKFAGSAPVDRVRTVAGAVSSEQAHSRGFLQSVDGQRAFVFPVRRNGAPIGELRSPPPPVGPRVTELAAGARP